MNYKKAKKLNPLWKEKSSPSKKFRSVSSYLKDDDNTSTHQEQEEFLKDNHELIFNVLQAKFSEYEEAAKKGVKAPVSLEDLQDFLSIFKRLVLTLKTANNVRYKLNLTGNVIKKCLHRKNAKKIRVTAFEILLILLLEVYLPQQQEIIEEANGESNGHPPTYSLRGLSSNSTIHASGEGISEMEKSEKFLLSLFGCALDFRPFVSGPNLSISTPISDDAPPICPAKGLPSVKKSLDILEKLMEYMNASDSTFQFWYYIFRENYLSVFYPQAYQQLGYALPNNFNLFLTTSCPHEIQRKVIDRCALWNESSFRSSILWNKENGILMLEIAKQSFMLPLGEYKQTISKSLNFFQSSFLTLSKMRLYGTRYQGYWQHFIPALSYIVMSQPPSEEVEIYKTFCKEIVSIYSNFYLTMYDKMDASTWQILLNCMLDMASHIVARKAAGHNEDVLLDLVMHRLFLLWISAPNVSKDMWDNFSRKIIGTLVWRGTISHWKEKMLDLTRFMTRSGKEKKLETSPKTSQGEALGDHLSIKTAIPIWHTLLNIFGNINKISEPNTYAIAISCLLEMTTIFLDDKLPSGDDAINITQLLQYYLPWLIEACCDEKRLQQQQPPPAQPAPQLQQQLPAQQALSPVQPTASGIILAYETLCKIFCYRHLVFDLHVMAHFYTTLLVGLSGSKEISTKIITSCANLFSVSPPGVAVVIPAFLISIRNMVVAGSFSTVESELSAICIINSLISYPNHFGDLGYSNLQGALVDYSIEEIRNEISNTLLWVLKRASNPENRSFAICGVCVLIFEELKLEKPRKDVVAPFLIQLLSLAQNQHDSVALTSLDILSALAVLYDPFVNFDKMLISSIIVGLCDNIKTLLQSKGEYRDAVIVAHFWSLVEWLFPLSSSPVDWFSQPSIAQKILQAIEVGFYVGKVPEKIDDAKLLEVKKNPSGRKPSSDMGTGWTTPTTPTVRTSKDSTKEKRQLLMRLPGPIQDIMNKNKDQNKDQNNNNKEAAHSDSDKTKASEMNEQQTAKENERAKQHELEREAREELEEGVRKTTLLNIQEAAESLLLYLLNHYQNFPNLGGVEMIGNVTKEDIDPDSKGLLPATLHFIHKNNSLWSLSDNYDKNGELYTRIVVRDCIGKNIWQMKIDSVEPSAYPKVFHSPRHSPKIRVRTSKDVTSPIPLELTAASIPPTYVRTKGETPRYRPDLGSSRTDMLLHLVDFVAETFPEEAPALWVRINSRTSPAFLRAESAKLPTPTSPPVTSVFRAKYFSTLSGSGETAKVEELVRTEEQKASRPRTLTTVVRQSVVQQYRYANDMASVLELQAEYETGFFEAESTDSQNKKILPIEKPAHPNPKTTAFTGVRQFLSQYGFLESGSRGDLVMIDECSKLRRNLDLLDKTNERETFKIGVLFVGATQTDQQDILNNSKGTHEYNCFLNGLGWVVDLSTHRGFMGGMDPGVNGKTTLYYANSTQEIIYHVVTMMPTDASDEKQFHKKRHVGNDHVHIVWSENVQESYDPSTIKSQFNDAHIIIYPLHNGLFRIQVLKKAKIDFFGPLVNGITVGKTVLPMLVRQTAVNAQRAVRATLKGYRKPLSSRMSSIQEIISKHKSEKTFDEFFSNLYQTTQHARQSLTRSKTVNDDKRGHRKKTSNTTVVPVQPPTDNNNNNNNNNNINNNNNNTAPPLTQIQENECTVTPSTSAVATETNASDDDTESTDSSDDDEGYDLLDLSADFADGMISSEEGSSKEGSEIFVQPLRGSASSGGGGGGLGGSASSGGGGLGGSASSGGGGEREKAHIQHKIPAIKLPPQVPEGGSTTTTTTGGKLSVRSARASARSPRGSSSDLPSPNESGV